MAAIYLTLAGPPQAPYPNGGDETYWMCQVAGALAARLHQAGMELSWSAAPAGGFRLALGSQAAPREQEGRKKGPQILWRAGDARGRRAAGALARELALAYPQPEFLSLEEAPALPELGEPPGPGAAVRLLYRDNPQDEAWLAGSAGAIGQALARALEEAEGRG